MLRRRQTGGFSILEILVVVAIMGLLTSIMVPLLLDAMQKARQKRTLADMRGIGTGWMSWLADTKGAAAAGAGLVFPTADLTERTYLEMHAFLRPTNTFFYLQDFPEVDAWGHPYRFLSSSQDILVCSSGQDTTFETCDLTDIPVAPFVGTDYAHDLIWANGYFVSWPGSNKAD